MAMHTVMNHSVSDSCCFDVTVYVTMSYVKKEGFLAASPLLIFFLQSLATGFCSLISNAGTVNHVPVVRQSDPLDSAV